MEDLQPCALEPGTCLRRLPSECQSLCHPAVLPPPAPPEAAGPCWHCAGEPRLGTLSGAALAGGTLHTAASHGGAAPGTDLHAEAIRTCA